MADQVLPYMALAGSGSSVTVTEITAHCRTNMWVIKKSIEGKFEVEDRTILWKSHEH
jgi:RNA 3'-terminal phosphate cyclase